MKIETDGKGQPYIEWEHGAYGDGVVKRAWINTRDRDDNKAYDWAGTSKYLCIGNFKKGVPQGFPQDFPIHNAYLTDEQILNTTVGMLSALGGVQP